MASKAQHERTLRTELEKLQSLRHDESAWKKQLKVVNRVDEARRNSER